MTKNFDKKKILLLLLLIKDMFLAPLQWQKRIKKILV